MSDRWTEKYNNLPDDVRLITSITNAQMRINQLLSERARVKRFYLAHIREIDSHIKNIRRWIEDNDKGDEVTA